MSATDVGFAMVAVTQAVMAMVWLLGSRLIGGARRYAFHWSAFAGCSALGFVLLMTALHASTPERAEVLRAAGNVLVVLALVALQRGIWLFVGRAMGWRAHALAVAVTLAASYIGLSPGGGAVRVGALSVVLALLSVAVTRDLYRHAREALGFRWPWLMGVPGVLSVLGYGYRGVRALLSPSVVASQFTSDSPLNVASSLSYAIIVLMYHGALMALVVGRLLADLQHRSRHDGLTGLLNRLSIEEGIEAQIRRGRRNAEVFSVLMLDLDHFKALNDRFGHAAGDQALRHVATVLKAGVREIDGIARIGGEEFLAFMPGASLAAARPVAERLREQLAALPVQIGGASAVVTVSIGVAEWSDPSEDMAGLLVRADAALYEAKDQGRDRVVEAGDTSPAPLLVIEAP